jgi:hypothetical protein
MEDKSMYYSRFHNRLLDLIKNDTFYLQVGTGNPTNKGLSNPYGSRVPATVNLTVDLKGYNKLEISSEIYCGSTATLKEIGLFPNNSGSDIYAYACESIEKQVTAGQTAPIKMVIKVPTVSSD